MDRRQFMRRAGGGLLTTLGASAAAGCVTRSESGTETETEVPDRMAEYDVFVVAGQSNAVGQGSSSDSPDVEADTAYEFKRLSDPNELVTLDDPVGEDNSPRDRQADTGSAWPAFAKTYYEETGREAVYVPFAVGGSEQSEKTGRDADLSWSESGDLDDWAQDKLDEALDFLDAEGYDYTLRGIVWHQGERDARAIDDGDMDKSDYKTAFEDHIDRWQNEYGSDFKWFVLQIAHEDGSDTDGFIDVREAQQEVCDEREHVHMASDIQKDFPEDGKLSDSVHYNQTGLNDMGTEGGSNTADVVDLPESASAIAFQATGGVLTTSSGVIQTATPDTTAPTISDFSVTVDEDTTAPTISNFELTSS